MAVFFCYWLTGQALEEVNMKLCGVLMAAAQGTNAAVIAGGDFQIEPGAVRRAGLCEETDFEVIAPSRDEDTCTSARGGRAIDWFIASKRLGAAQESVEARNDAPLRPTARSG